MQLRALGRRCRNGSATVLGDLAQGTTPWSTASWESVLNHLGQDGGEVTELTLGFRVPREVLDYAARLLPVDRPRPGRAAVAAARRGLAVRPPRRRPCADAVLRGAGPRGLDRRHRRPTPPSTAVSRRSPDSRTPCSTPTPTEEHRLLIVPATLAKGLEYDHVIVVEPADIVAAEPRGLARLYVVLTRAVTSLTVLHHKPLPPQLAS